MKKILVIGGGPAGLRVSGQLAKNQCSVTIVEKSDHLGGHLALWDRLFPSGVKAKDVLEELLKDVSNVEIHLKTTVKKIENAENRYVVTFSDDSQHTFDTYVDATGFELFQAEKKQEYGYGIYNQVITNAELEEFFRHGADSRIQQPHRIGLVHCVGSRDVKVNNTYCSKVCCATALKQACELRELFPEAEIYTFYMDLRMFGKGYEDLYLKAQQDCGIICVRGRVCEVAEDLDGSLVIKAEDTLLGKPLKMHLDLLVLMCGMERKDGFVTTVDEFTRQNSTPDGHFVVGTAISPMTLPETLANADAACLEILKS